MQSMSENDFESFASTGVMSPNNARLAGGVIQEDGGPHRDCAGDLFHATGAIAVFRRQMTPNWQAGCRPVVEKMVDLVGIEPTTSSMPWKRAPSCATGPLFSFSLSLAAASNSTPAANLN
jgi:hypothetical protein